MVISLVDERQKRKKNETSDWKCEPTLITYDHLPLDKFNDKRNRMKIEIKETVAEHLSPTLDWILGFVAWQRHIKILRQRKFISIVANPVRSSWSLIQRVE